jgi:hypothetical protein
MISFLGSHQESKLNGYFPHLDELLILMSLRSTRKRPRSKVFSISIMHLGGTRFYRCVHHSVQRSQHMSVSSIK